MSASATQGGHKNQYSAKERVQVNNPRSLEGGRQSTVGRICETD